MEDKRIQDLTAASEINDNDYFVLEQGGEAMKLMGELLKGYINRNIMSVTVSQLPAGSQPTVSFNTQTGALSLGIPKGDTGAQGIQGPAGSDAEVTSENIAAALGYTPYQKPITGIPKADLSDAVLDDLVKYDNDEFASPLPLNADQLNGHPDTYFAKQDDMSAAEADIAENSRDIASLQTATSNLSASKVDKENGKGLSTNDFTDGYKQNVDANNLARHTHGNKSVLDMITQATLDLIATITGKYVKPSGGIPKADLDSDVQESLGKADTALQEHQSLSAYRTASEQDVIDARKYSASNPPPYPVTSVNGQTGGVVLNYITFDEEES